MKDYLNIFMVGMRICHFIGHSAHSLLYVYRGFICTLDSNM
jgi:hypothetical protein